MARRKIINAALEERRPVLDLRDEGEGLTQELRPKSCVRTTSLVTLPSFRRGHDRYTRLQDTKRVSHGWVAQIQGMDEQRRLEREFLSEIRLKTRPHVPGEMTRDHEYTLEAPGIYEAQTVEGGEERRVFFIFDEEGFELLTRAQVYDLIAPALDFGEVRSHVSAGRWHDAWAAARCLENPDEKEAAVTYVHRALAQAQSALPSLDGTPRQVQWAMQLRQQALEALDAWREEVTALQHARRTQDDLSALYRRQDEARVEIMTVVTATYWITNRQVWGSGRDLARLLSKRRAEIDRIAAEEAATPKP